MVNRTIVLGNLKIIKTWANNGRKEKPGINPIRCEKVEKWIDEAIIFLEAQEPVKPYIDYDGRDVWRCANCGSTLFHLNHTHADENQQNFVKFCRHCGMAVKWE